MPERLNYSSLVSMAVLVSCLPHEEPEARDRYCMKAPVTSRDESSRSSSSSSSSSSSTTTTTTTTSVMPVACQIKRDSSMHPGISDMIFLVCERLD